MKGIFVALVAAVLLCGCQSVRQNETKPAISKEECAMSMQKTCQFLKDAGHYFIATDENGQPRVRPFGTIHIFEDKLYIQTGRSKNVAKQLLANGRTELCAFNGKQWIRVSGVLVDDPRKEAKVSMLEAYPLLKSMYSADDDNTMVLYFKPGTVTATISSFKEKPVVMHF